MKGSLSKQTTRITFWLAAVVVMLIALVSAGAEMELTGAELPLRTLGVAIFALVLVAAFLGWAQAPKD